MFVLLALAISRPAEACSVCFVGPDAAYGTALRMGVFSLLFILLAVVGFFSVFFWNINKKQEQFKKMAS